MSLKVVILGAGGLVGARLVRKIINETEMFCGPNEKLPIKELHLVDLYPMDKVIDKAVFADPRVKVTIGDLCDASLIRKVCNPNGATRVTVLHIAALLSGYAEDNFKLGIKVNLHGPLAVMDELTALRENEPSLGGKPQIYIFCSTDYVTCYNDYNKKNQVNEESFRLSPVSYGVQKAAIELFVCDYTRKGFLDGRVARISAVIGRPGFSNSISYPYTGIFTQPLSGKNYDVPLPMEIPYPCSSLNNNVDSIMWMCSKMDGSKLGANRVIQLPAKSWTLSQIWQATQEVAKEQNVPLGSVKQVAASSGKTSVKEINVCPHVDCGKAEKMGLPMKVDLKDIIRDYIHNYVKVQPIEVVQNQTNAKPKL